MVTKSIKKLVLKQIVDKISGEKSVLKKNVYRNKLGFHCHILKIMNQWVFSNRLWKKHLEIFIHLNINVVNISWKSWHFNILRFFSCLPIGSITLLTSGCFLPALCLSRYVSPSCFPGVAFLCASSVMVPWRRPSPQRLVWHPSLPGRLRAVPQRPETFEICLGIPW